MLDFILIQHSGSGLTLFEFKGEHTVLDPNHSSVLSGFLSAIQGISKELNLGNITQISTDTHHCIFYTELNVTIVIIVDREDCPNFWYNKAKEILNQFLVKFSDSLYINDLSYFRHFKKILMEFVSH